LLQSKSHVGEEGGEAVDGLGQGGVRGLEGGDGGVQAGERGVDELGAFVRAGGLEGGDIGEAGDAAGVLLVGLGEGFDLGFQAGEDVEQFGPGVILDVCGGADFFFEFGDAVLNHRGLYWRMEMKCVVWFMNLARVRRL